MRREACLQAEGYSEHTVWSVVRTTNVICWVWWEILLVCCL